MAYSWQLLGCGRVVAETDCIAVVEAMNHQPNYYGSEAAIYAECTQLAQYLGRFTIQHCNREANRVAGYLAKLAIESNASSNWEGDAPSFIQHLLVNDLAII